MASAPSSKSVAQSPSDELAEELDDMEFVEQEEPERPDSKEPSPGGLPAGLMLCLGNRFVEKDPSALALRKQLFALLASPPHLRQHHHSRLLVAFRGYQERNTVPWPLQPSSTCSNPTSSLGMSSNLQQARQPCPKEQQPWDSPKGPLLTSMSKNPVSASPMGTKPMRQ